MPMDVCPLVPRRTVTGLLFEGLPAMRSPVITKLVCPLGGMMKLNEPNTTTVGLTRNPVLTRVCSPEAVCATTRVSCRKSPESLLPNECDSPSVRDAETVPVDGPAHVNTISPTRSLRPSERKISGSAVASQVIWGTTGGCWAAIGAIVKAAAAAQYRPRRHTWGLIICVCLIVCTPTPEGFG